VALALLDACQLSVPRASLLPASKNLHNSGHRAGGVLPLGYYAQDRKPVSVSEAKSLAFSPLCKLGLVRLLKDELQACHCHEQVLDERAGSRVGWQAMRAQCASSDAAEPHLRGEMFTRSYRIRANTRRSPIGSSGMWFKLWLPATPPANR